MTNTLGFPGALRLSSTHTVWIPALWLISNHQHADTEHRLEEKTSKTSSHKPAPGVFNTSLSEETFLFTDTFSCSVAQKHRQLFTRRKRQALPRQEDDFPGVVHGSAPQQHPRGPREWSSLYCVCSVASNSLRPHGR